MEIGKWIWNAEKEGMKRRRTVLLYLLIDDSNGLIHPTGQT